MKELFLLHYCAHLTKKLHCPWMLKHIKPRFLGDACPEMIVLDHNAGVKHLIDERQLAMPLF